MGNSTYTPPTPATLQQLQKSLGMTGKQMAKLAHVSEQHWRKYTTAGENNRVMTYTTLFHLVANVTLHANDINLVRKKMAELAEIDDLPPTVTDEVTAFMNMGRDACRNGYNMDPENIKFEHKLLTSAWRAGWYFEEMRQEHRKQQAEQA